jgi:hypothetical protein
MDRRLAHSKLGTAQNKRLQKSKATAGAQNRVKTQEHSDNLTV